MKRPSPSLIISCIALFCALGGSGYAITQAGTPVIAGPHGDVTISSDFAGLYPLTLMTPRYGYGALNVKDYTGKVSATIDSTGQFWSHATGSDTPRLLLSANGYEGSDVMQTLIGSSAVSAISAGGEIESYNYYVNGDNIRFSVRDAQDNLQGGIDASGRFVTLAHTAPDPRDMESGEARLWFNPTPFSGGMMVTTKDSGGVVRTVKLG